MSLSTIKTKTRSLVGDISKTDSETFRYSNSTVFALAEDNINTVSKVTKNDSTLTTGDWDYDSTNNEVTVSASLSDGDLITIYYTYNIYSSNELTEYIRAALAWVSYEGHEERDFELEDDTTIIPTPTNKEEDLIAIIASIIIKPNFSEYRLPNITVRYPKNMDKETKIVKFINRFKRGVGIFDVVEFKNYNT